jgi:hypothetical protein
MEVNDENPWGLLREGEYHYRGKFGGGEPGRGGGCHQGGRFLERAAIREKSFVKGAVIRLEGFKRGLPPGRKVFREGCRQGGRFLERAATREESFVNGAVIREEFFFFGGGL